MPDANPERRGVRAAIGILLLLEVALWIALVGAGGLFRDGPNGKTLSVDFAVFLSGAQVLRHGGNPYDPATLYTAERSLLGRQHIPATKNAGLVRLGNPPILYWALEPLTGMPYAAIALAWVALMYTLSAAGCVAVLRALAVPHPLVALALFLLMPQVVISAAYGNVTSVVFFALAVAILIARQQPAVAGLALALAWLKPQVGLPFVLLFFLFGAAPRRGVVAGFAAGTALIFAGSILGPGPAAFADWLHGLSTFSASVGQQPNLASLSGLYASWAPGPVRLAISASLLAACLGLTWWAWSRYGPSSLAATAWLWFAWFLGTPYAHFPDEIVLGIPLLAIAARSDRDTTRLSIAAAYVMFFSLVLFPRIGGLSLLPIPLLGLAVACYVNQRDRATPESGSAAA